MIKIIQASFKKAEKYVLYHEKTGTFEYVSDYSLHCYASQPGGIFTHLVEYRKDDSNVYQLVNCILKGHTFLPAYTENGSTNSDWIESSIIGIDIDHGLGIDEAIERCERYNILPTFIYPTFSHLKIDSEGNADERFRMIFVLKKPNKNEGLHKVLIKMLMLIFPECDGSCKNVCRLWHGTNKGWFMAQGELSELHEQTLSIKSLCNAMDQWLVDNVEENERHSFLENHFGRPYRVSIVDDQLAIKVDDQEENIEVV